MGKNGGDAEFSIELVVGFFDADSWNLYIFCNAGGFKAVAIVRFSQDDEGKLYNENDLGISMLLNYIKNINSQT